MNVKLEAILRTIGVFLSVFFTVRWSTKTTILKWDIPLNISAMILAFVANFYGPLKLSIT